MFPFEGNIPWLFFPLAYDKCILYNVTSSWESYTVKIKMISLPKTNIFAPENEWFFRAKPFILGMLAYFQRDFAVSFREAIVPS